MPLVSFFRPLSDDSRRVPFYAAQAERFKTVQHCGEMWIKPHIWSPRLLRINCGRWILEDPPGTFVEKPLELVADWFDANPLYDYMTVAGTAVELRSGPPEVLVSDFAQHNGLNQVELSVPTNNRVTVAETHTSSPGAFLTAPVGTPNDSRTMVLRPVGTLSPAMPPWRRAFERLSRAFEKNLELELRHVRVQCVGDAGKLPSRWREPLDSAECRRESVWRPGCADLPTYETPQRAILYGDRAALEVFDQIAVEAWRAVPGSASGKAQYAPVAENETDRWLTLVYRELTNGQLQGLDYLIEGDWVVKSSGGSAEVCEPAERYALPMTYGPILNPDLRPILGEPFKRWRISHPTVNVFHASLVALDQLLADPNPAGKRLVSWEELAIWQNSPGFQNANHILDFIILGNGRRFPIYRNSARVISKSVPSICPKARPSLPPEFLPKIADLYRSRGLISDGQTIHWVGDQATIDSVCTCTDPSAHADSSPDTDLPPYEAEHQTWHTKIPEPEPVSSNHLTSFAEEVDVVLLTVNDTELEAVLRRLDPIHTGQSVLKGAVEQGTYYLGKFGGSVAVVTKCRMGSLDSGAAMLATQHAIRVWRPRAVLMIGIAFGKDPTKQNIADVLVAAQIISYEPQRVREDQTIPRGPITPSDSTLMDRFDNVIHWCFARPDGSHCQRQIGPLLSGEKLVDDSGLKRSLFDRYPQAIGGEMEGVGFAAAADRERVPWILVKAVCDWGDGKKHKKHQPLAATAATSLVHHVLSHDDALHGLKKKRP